MGMPVTLVHRDVGASVFRKHVHRIRHSDFHRKYWHAHAKTVCPPSHEGV